MKPLATKYPHASNHHHVHPAQSLHRASPHVGRDVRDHGAGCGAEVLLARCTSTHPTIEQVMLDPELHAIEAFDLGLNIPSLTSWYEEQDC